MSKRSWTDEQLRIAVAISLTYSEAITRLGIVPRGGNYRIVKRRIAELGFTTDHFVGARTMPFRDRSRRQSIEMLLVIGNRTSSLLRRRLITSGLKKPECELCGWAERASDGRLPLELDHINGEHDDNRLENLRILCPNCHSLQPTYRALNRRRKRGVG